MDRQSSVKVVRLLTIAALLGLAVLATGKLTGIIQKGLDK